MLGRPSSTTATLGDGPSDPPESPIDPESLGDPETVTEEGDSTERPTTTPRGGLRRWRGRPSVVRTRSGRPDTGHPVLSARAGAALGVFIVLIAILAIPFKEWVSQRARISELETQLAWHTQRAEELQGTLDRWKDPAYIEAQARTRLHFVKPGEVGYVLLTDDPDAAPVTQAERPLAQAPTGQPWWSGLWATVELADEGSADSAPEAPPEAAPAASYDQ